MHEVVQVENISKNFGSFNLGEITFKVNKGEILGILGPNGAGKTTPMRIIAGLMKPDYGNVYVLGENPESVMDRIGYLPEERGLYKKWKVREVLRYFADLKGKGETDYWLERLGMRKYENKKVEELSKGLQQKIQLLVAIQHNPDVVILDEPFSGLDAINIRLVMEIVKEMKERGSCVIISTHILNLAERVCDKVLLINNGRQVISGKIDEILQEEVNEVEYLDNGRTVKEITNKPLKELIQSGLEIVSFRRRKLSLEEVFLREVRK